jgi:hypothetical protein
MTILPKSALLCAIGLSVMTGCASAPSTATLNEVRATSNPTDRPQRTITNFTPALRCMDDMMFAMGTRDVSMMMEEFRDATQKQLPLSARDMLTSAISDMTRRSRGVRLTVFGSDQQNLTQFLQLAQKSNTFAVVPEFNIRGTISQLDEAVKKSGGSVGASLAESLFGIRLGSDTKFSVIGLDAAVVQTATMTLIPGVSSKNTTVLSSRDSNAGDGQARLVNPGIGLVFSFATSRADGPAQAARNMIELATVELVGKLIKAPYWQCVGTPDTDAEVQREMDDWFFSMEEEERISFYQNRMRERRYYDGAVNGQSDAAFASALLGYRKAMGLSPQGPLDIDFFKQFVTRSVPRGSVLTARKPADAGVAAPEIPAPAVVAASGPLPAPLPVATPVPLVMTQVTQALAGAAQKGTHLRIEVSQPGYVYCYAQDPVTQRIQRIFPNRFSKDPRLDPGKPLALPGAGKFVLNPAAQYACLHTPREVYGDLPPPLRWGDFEDIRLSSFEDIQSQFSKTSGAAVHLVRSGLAPQ